MSLFESHITTEKKQANDQPGSFKLKPRNRFALGVKKSDLSELIGEINKNEAIHIPSIGSWSLADMIEYVISKIGPSQVFLTSWAVKSKAVITLLNLRENKLITELHCIFDSRVPSTCPDAWQLSEANIESLKLTKIHAKIVTLKSDSHSIVIVSTANLTSNPRIERYVITENSDLYNYEQSWLERTLLNSKPFS